MAPDDLGAFITFPQLYSCRDIRFGKTCATIPEKMGLYAWYFKSPPKALDIDVFNKCHSFEEKRLLYIGLAGSRKESKRNLKSRIKGCHIGGGTQNSTLRFSLAALNDFPLLADGKDLLNVWLDENAFVCWVESQEPWFHEKILVHKFKCPLNIQGNKEYVYKDLKRLRKSAKALLQSKCAK
jgi:hypothetical protein